MTAILGYIEGFNNSIFQAKFLHKKKKKKKKKMSGTVMLLCWIFSYFNGPINVFHP